MVCDGADPRKALSTRGVQLGEDRSVMNRVPTLLAGFLLITCLLLLSWDVQAQIEATEGACSRGSAAIDVRVQGVRSDHGYVTFVLYGDNPDDFLAKGKKLFKQQFAAKRGTVAFCVIVSKAGAYAASVYHDENGNKKFDRNWIGIPAEGAGFSNNPTLLLGPPSHAQAAFQVSSGPKRVEIQLNYSIVSGQQNSNLP
jgi:uncharacterized protein (DUF2141 family)